MEDKKAESTDFFTKLIGGPSRTTAQGPNNTLRRPWQGVVTGQKLKI